MVEQIDDNEAKQIKELRKLVPEFNVEKFEDGFILRWLRENNHDIEKAEAGLKKHWIFRKAWGIDDLLLWKKPEVAQKCYPYGYPCMDNDGSPVLLTLWCHVDVEGLMKSMHAMDYIKTSLQHVEEGLNLAKYSAKKKGVPYEQLVLVVDMAPLTTAHYTYKPFTNSYLTLTALFQENYPLAFKKIIAIQTPTIATYAYSLLRPFLNETIQNQVELIGDNWKERLFESIDPDEFPAYWGGNKFEGKDDKCQSKVLFYEGTIPESYYKTDNMEDDEETETVTVYAGDKHFLDFDVEDTSTQIFYKFSTNGEDIGFAVYYDPSGESTEVTSMEVIFPKVRLECTLVPIEGTIQCEKKGKYTIEFDNSYSWFSSKEVFYKTELIAH